MGGMIRAIEQLGLDKNEVVLVSGIGCSSRVSGYLDFHTMHTIHGRALAFATGVKLGRPYLKVIVPMGDGDALAIGGNHLIHAARRNIDVTAIIMNKKGTTAVLGTLDHCFDIAELAKGAGASFVARTTTYHAKEMIKMIHDAIDHKGFSLVEVMSQCPTYYGRKNDLGTAVDMMKGFRDKTVPKGSKKLEEHPELVERGVFVNEARAEYVSSYMDLLEELQEERGNPG
jgi:2-oxoglutarate ferredoxin oxidoreductase subunit beta